MTDVLTFGSLRTARSPPTQSSASHPCCRSQAFETCEEGEKKKGFVQRVESHVGLLANSWDSVVLET